MNTIKLCIIGFGNASKEFCKMLLDKQEDIRSETGFNVVVNAISTKSKGKLLNTDGLDLEKVFREIEMYEKFHENNPSFVNCSNIDLIQESKAHVMVELSTLSIEDGQPAITHIETAFKNDMHVITANKGPIAWAYNRLKTMAQEKKLQFLHETTVMDGTPVFNLVKETLLGCRVLSFKGILNSTTNFILEEMEKGVEYETAIKEAQIRGFAEADPSLDIDGWDAAAKTTALANVLMNANLTPMAIDRIGISHITRKDVQEALNSNKKIKLLCEGFIEEGQVVGRVHPVLIDKKDIFSSIDATSSILSITTDLMGQISIVEQNPEIQQTAYGIYSDLLTLLKKY